MPHYRDGTEAKVGDLVRGVSYNRNKREIVGTVMSITPGAESCNCVVAFATVRALPKLPEGFNWYELLQGRSCSPHSGDSFQVLGEFDYGETRAFDLIARAAD